MNIDDIEKELRSMEGSVIFGFYNDSSDKEGIVRVSGSEEGVSLLVANILATFDRNQISRFCVRYYELLKQEEGENAEEDADIEGRGLIPFRIACAAATSLNEEVQKECDELKERAEALETTVENLKAALAALAQGKNSEAMADEN